MLTPLLRRRQVPSHANGAIARSWGGLILTVSFVEIWGRSDAVSHHGGNEAVVVRATVVSEAVAEFGGDLGGERYIKLSQQIIVIAA